MKDANAIAQHVRTIFEQKEARKAAARRAFWSDHPLNLTFRTETGQTVFSLRDFIAFVVEMPAEQFEACTRGGHDAR